MKIKTILLSLFAAVAGAGFIASANAQETAKAEGMCETVNRIIDSGLNNEFAAVAGLTLPNSDGCAVRDMRSDENSFLCGWNQESGQKFDKLYDEVDELRDEVEDLIQKGDNLSQKERELFQYGLYGDAYAVKEKIESLRARYNSKRAQYDDKYAQLEVFERRVNKEAKKQAGALYTGLYSCFSDGKISDGADYKLEDDNKSWQWEKENGCSILVAYQKEVVFVVNCPEH